MPFDAQGEWFDHWQDVPAVQQWCPECDVPVSGLFVTAYCAIHAPSPTGTADSQFKESFWLSGSIDAEPITNAKYCAFIHRKEI